jgi:hypothetical protein
MSLYAVFGEGVAALCDRSRTKEKPRAGKADRGLNINRGNSNWNKLQLRDNPKSETIARQIFLRVGAV